MQFIKTDRRFLIAGFLFSIALHVAVLLPWLGDEAGAGTSEGIADLSQAPTDSHGLIDDTLTFVDRVER